MGLTQITTGGVDNNINIDSNTLKVDGTNNRVGIGTAHPDFNLDVGGPIGVFESNNIVWHDGTGARAGQLGFTSGEVFTIKSSNSQTERLRIDSSGQVGIGTSSNSQQLHVSDSTNYQGILVNGSAAPSICFDNATNTAVKWRVGLSGVNVSNFCISQAGNNDKFIIDSSGNVGIATASPAGRLSVGPDQDIVFGNQASSGTGGTGRFVATGGVVYLQAGQAATSGSDAPLVVTGYGGVGERLRIDSSGNVGIGTTSAGAVVSGMPTLHLASATAGRSGAIRWKNTGETNKAAAYWFGTEFQIGTETSHPLKFTTADTERMRIDSSGFIHQKFTSNNSSTPEGLFINNQNNATGNNASLIFSNDSGNRKKIAIAAVDVGNYGASDLVFALDGADSGSVSLSSDEKMRIDSSGRVGIKNSSPGSQYFNDLVIGDGTSDHGITLHAGSTSASSIAFSDSTSGSGRYAGYLQYDHTIDSMRFHTNGGNERLRITSAGDVQIKDFSPRIGAALTSVSSNFSSYFAASGTTNSNLPMIVERYNDNGVSIEFKRSNSVVGNINVTATSTVYATSSDYRLKENVVDLDGAITRVKQLAPKRFNFIVDADTTVDGFLAHEAQTVVPEAVTGTHNEVDDDGNAVMQGIDQSKLVPLLTAALQEAIAKIETLETKVAALEAAE